MPQNGAPVSVGCSSLVAGSAPSPSPVLNVRAYVSSLGWAGAAVPKTQRHASHASTRNSSGAKGLRRENRCSLAAISVSVTRWVSSESGEH